MNNSNKNKQTYNHLELALQAISSGNAVLFLGAGFSNSATGLNGINMPTSAILAQKLGDLKEFDAEGDLTYASSRYLSKGGDELSLIKILRETFTVTEIKPHHKAIASAPWRNVYTTNYDLCYETAAKENNILVNTIDIKNKPSDYLTQKQCIHLNGSLNILTSESLKNDFKLTLLSYLSSNTLLQSPWLYLFKKDLEFSSAIIFVGYSLYDIKIQEILNKNQEFISKTFFITQDSINDRTKFELSQFGSIIPIGAEKFGNEIEKQKNNFCSTPEQLALTSLWEYHVTTKDIMIHDSDVDKFLLYGNINNKLIDTTLFLPKGAPLLINRDEIKRAIELIKANSNIVITANFGNGKSIFSSILRAHLTSLGMRIFTADQIDPHELEDLSNLVKNNIKGCLLIDSYEQNFKLIEHYAQLSPQNLQLIICARTSIHEHYKHNLLNLNLNVSEITIDDLSEKEINEFIDIIDNSGNWADKAGLSFSSKKRLIEKNGNQISSNLLDILQSPHIMDRIKALTQDFLLKKENKDTTFAIALLLANNIRATKTLISEISFNNRIYDLEYQENKDYRQIFGVEGSKIQSKSSTFSSFLISHCFSSFYIVEQLLKIMSYIGNVKMHFQPEDFKNLEGALRKFSIIERLLPENNRTSSLLKYYEELKMKIKWLNNDPHFWLQYGMARIANYEYDKAQTYFTQAYALAKSRDNYFTDYIDTQQARLFLLRLLKCNVLEDLPFELFTNAHQLFIKLPNNYYKYRQLQNYKVIFDKLYSSFTNENQLQFASSCKIIADSINKTIEQNNTSSDKTAIQTLNMFNSILSVIK